MTSATETRRCSLWARSFELAPAGTAGTPTGFLLVDWPLPWPSDIGEIGGLAAVRAVAFERGWRIQTTVPITGLDHRIALYQPTPGDGFGTYEGRQVVSGAGVDAGVQALADGLGDPLSGEVLVCTHGSRDVCCGSFGTTLAMELTGAKVSDGSTSTTGAGLLDRPVRRTSHTGGHRFAPTSIVLPEGTLWAFADRDLLTRVTTRSGPIEDVLAHYRGCAGLGSPALQALESKVLGEVGWSLFDGRRGGERLEGDRYRLSVTEPSGEQQAWEADVAVGRRVVLPECGSSTATGGKPTTELSVGPLERVL